MEAQLKALVVDDSELSRMIVSAAISKTMHVVEAENGLVAVKKFLDAVTGGAPFNIVFMDIVMPEMDGKEAVKKIREFEAGQGMKRTPLYMISASEMLGDVEDLVNGLIRKPASRNLLDEIMQLHFCVALNHQGHQQ